MIQTDQLLAYPIIKEIGYRENINSNELNEMLRSLEESVLRSIIRSTELNEKINMLNLAVTSAYTALGKSSQVYSSYPTTSDITSSTSFVGVAYATSFGDVSGVRQDKIGGITTLDWNSNKKLSKVPIYNGIVSSNVKIYVDDVLRPTEDSVYNLVDLDRSTFWIESTTAGEHSIEIVMPPSTSKTFNYIEIIPFPIFGIEIKRIEYKDLQNKSQIIYPTQENTFYSNAGPLIFHTTPREYNNSIKIIFNVLDGINVMGFSIIDICTIEYFNNINTIYLKFENIPDYDLYGNSVTEIDLVSIDIDFYVDGVINDVYDNAIREFSIVPDIISDFKVMLSRKKGYQTISTSTITLGEVAGKKTLYLKCVINGINNTTPVIRGAKLNYTYGTIL
jgi:hypothetical protein